MYSIPLPSGAGNISLTLLFFFFNFFLHFALFLIVFEIHVQKLSGIGSFINIKFKSFLQKNELTVE